MNKLLFTLCLAFTALFANAAEETVNRYGYCPEVFAEEDVRGQGSGMNGFVAGMVCFNPTTDPVMARLSGHKITGIRCYLRNDYKQSKQGRSLVMYATGDINSDATTQKCDFLQGWNDVYFDTPITIDSEPIYLGVQVYESRSQAYPLVTFAHANVAGTCFINLEKEGWAEYSDRGTLLIEAILDSEAESKLGNLVYAQVGDSPMVVAPSKPFDAGVYFNNQTDKEISSLELQVIGQGDETAYTQEITFDTPLAAREGRKVEMEITAGSEVGLSQWIHLSVSKINGEATNENRIGESFHYVSNDAFVRIPLIEEFTSQSCQACPFMSYYLDMAMEEYEGDLVYITHHAGFARDRFTKPVDNELLYLFGNEATFNPAVMYDRQVPVGEYTPIIGANVAETTPYIEAITTAAAVPAKAEVFINASKTDDGMVNCEVSGHASSEMIKAGEQMYLSTYLVEYGIPVSSDMENLNYQAGLTGDDAPADIMERVHHNGIIRHNFCTEHIGDLLTFDGNAYSVSYPAVEVDEEWILDNCRIVAFVHKINKDDLTDNFVLNAGFYEFNPSGIDTVKATEKVNFKVDANRTITASENVDSFAIYDLQGHSLPTSTSLMQGIYIVKYTTAAGNNGVKKLYVK